MTHFARPGNGVKLPQLGAGASVVSARIAGRPGGNFENRRTYRNHVAKHRGHAPIADHHVDDALFAETRIELAGIGVQRDQIAAGSQRMRGGFCLSPGQ